MRNLTNGQLSAYLKEAEAMLERLPEQINATPELQEAVRIIMEAGVEAAAVFERLKQERPGLANQLMFASVASLANLHTARAMKAELKRRAEGN